MSIILYFYNYKKKIYKKNYYYLNSNISRIHCLSFFFFLEKCYQYLAKSDYADDEVVGKKDLQTTYNELLEDRAYIKIDARGVKSLVLGKTI